MTEPQGKVLHIALHLLTLPAIEAAVVGAALCNKHCTELLGMVMLVTELHSAASSMLTEGTTLWPRPCQPRVCR